jgi:hypothetical protein
MAELAVQQRRSAGTASKAQDAPHRADMPGGELAAAPAVLALQATGAMLNARAGRVATAGVAQLADKRRSLSARRGVKSKRARYHEYDEDEPDREEASESDSSQSDEEQAESDSEPESRRGTDDEEDPVASDEESAEDEASEEQAPADDDAYSDSEDEANRAQHAGRGPTARGEPGHERFKKKGVTPIEYYGHEVSNYTKKNREPGAPKVDNKVAPENLATAGGKLNEDAKAIHGALDSDRAKGATTISTVILLHTPSGQHKKFAFANTDPMPATCRAKAEALGYHAVKAPQTHAESEMIAYLYVRSPIYEHADMGVDKAHCAECRILMGRYFGGEDYQTHQAHSENLYTNYHAPDVLREAVGVPYPEPITDKRLPGGKLKKEKKK